MQLQKTKGENIKFSIGHIIILSLETVHQATAVLRLQQAKHEQDHQLILILPITHTLI